ncbi:MAG: hypothetical protein HYY50_00120 [Candidatus Kerfeldbacteria bacterium]|nr:hypothetical protein [Candidatus Kerfeldbacteria bacterium]
MLVKCETRAQQFLELSERANPKDFSKAYSLLLSIWPLIDFADIFGSFIPDQISPPLAKKAQRLRHQYDQLLSVGEKTFVSMAKKKLPASFSPIVQLLTKQEVESVRLPPDINRRKRGFIFYRGKLFADLRLETFARRRNITFDAAAGSSGPLRGTSVIQKKASGRVKVVFEHSQLRKVRPGDVLVAPMTTPDFVTAARRAAAIVTDEGGAMCHAAIVAREFGIVCIVGTKYATQVFQDGDQVEVDGNRGMVKLLTRR